jgi:hypothetical protein
MIRNTHTLLLDCAIKYLTDEVVRFFFEKFTRRSIWPKCVCGVLSIDVFFNRLIAATRPPALQLSDANAHLLWCGLIQRGMNDYVQERPLHQTRDSDTYYAYYSTNR